jgi:hypothetical protein
MPYGRLVVRQEMGPPAFLQLGANPLRWRLLSELARGDRQVRELTALFGQPQNLVSYHLSSRICDRWAQRCRHRVVLDHERGRQFRPARSVRGRSRGCCRHAARCREHLRAVRTGAAVVPSGTSAGHSGGFLRRPSPLGYRDSSEGRSTCSVKGKPPG